MRILRFVRSSWIKKTLVKEGRFGGSGDPITMISCNINKLVLLSRLCGPGNLAGPTKSNEKDRSRHR